MVILGFSLCIFNDFKRNKSYLFRMMSNPHRVNKHIFQTYWKFVDFVLKLHLWQETNEFKWSPKKSGHISSQSYARNWMLLGVCILLTLSREIQNNLNLVQTVLDLLYNHSTLEQFKAQRYRDIYDPYECMYISSFSLKGLQLTSTRQEKKKLRLFFSMLISEPF